MNNLALSQDNLPQDNIEQAIEGMDFSDIEKGNQQNTGEDFSIFLERLSLEDLEDLHGRYMEPRKQSPYEGLYDIKRHLQEQIQVRIHLYQKYLEIGEDLSNEQKKNFEIFQTQISVSDMVSEYLHQE